MPPDFPSNAAVADRRVVDPVPSRAPSDTPAVEQGGPAGPEPTRFGDWERKGRCIDF